MYVINKNLDSESRRTNFIDVGIHNNVELTGVEYNVSQNGNEFIVFKFVKEDGKTLDHTEYKPKDDDPQKLVDKTTNQLKRLKHIVTKFISEDEYNVNVRTFKELCEKTIQLLGNAYKGVKVRIKVVYNNNNYTSLPNYVPFIERMDVAKSNLEILSIDKMTKDKPDIESNTQTNPFEQNVGDSSIGITEDDLPF